MTLLDKDEDDDDFASDVDKRKSLCDAQLLEQLNLNHRYLCTLQGALLEDYFDKLNQISLLMKGFE